MKVVKRVEISLDDIRVCLIIIQTSKIASREALFLLNASEVMLRKKM